MRSEESLITRVKSALMDYGAVGEKWRVKILSAKPVTQYSDYYYIEVDTYRPRCRKPLTGWKLMVYAPSMTFWFDKSEHWDY